MLRYLLDENITPKVADGVRSRSQEIIVETVHRWQDGAFLGKPDAAVLAAARDAGLTLVTFDLRSLPALLRELAVAGEDHAGVVFVSRASVFGADSGTLIRALIAHWRRHHGEPWVNRVAFLLPE